MSKSYHKTRRDLKGKTEKEINGMIHDPDSVLNELVKKRIIKKETINKRKASKRQKNNEL